MRVVAVIPARFQSSRFPGKPLALINGKEMIIWVAEQCEKAMPKKDIYIATDSKKIFNLVKKKNYQCIMTKKNNLTGTDRVAEVAIKVKANIYLNVQGDEPLIKPASIKKIISAKLKDYKNVICAYSKILDFGGEKNINIPKVVFNSKNELLYISRSAIPFSKEQKSVNYFKQVCIYAFNRQELLMFKKLKKKPHLESIEDIEILRFFELNKKIKMVKTESSSIAVDLPSDIKLVERILNKKNIKIKYDSQ
jgi:3-deoxy-manno-octulosonate cytidylyltransferase (CMP-KDO synthetase)